MKPHPEPTIFRLSHHPGCNPLEFEGIGIQRNYRIHTDAIKDTLIPPTTKERGRPRAGVAQRSHLAHTLPLTETPASSQLLTDHWPLPLYFSFQFSEFQLFPIALFGQTAKQWSDANSNADGNLRDHAPLEQLVVLTNLESRCPF